MTLEPTPVTPVADVTDATLQDSEATPDDMVPHRTIASPRSLSDEIERPVSVVSTSSLYSPNIQVPENAVEDEDPEPRELPRRRRHSARRSSQNSYLSQSFIDTLKSSPVKMDSTEVHIAKSRPLGSGSRQSSGRRTSVRSVTNDTITEIPVATKLPMPGSAETFSPIAQLPSDVEVDDVEAKSIDGAIPASSTMGAIHMAHTSISAPGRLNPAAKPFIFGATVPAPPSFDVSSQPANSPSGLDALHSTPLTEKQDQDEQPAASSSSSTMPNIHVEYADDNMFRKWTFPSGPVGVSMYGDYEEHQHKRSHSDITDPGEIERSASPAAKLHGLAKDKTPERPSTASDKAAPTTTVDVDDWHSHSHWSADGFSQGVRGHGSLGLSTRTSAEFPMRATPPRVLAVVNDDPRAHSGGGGFMSPTLDDMPLGDDPAPEILHLLHKIDEDMASFKAEVERQHASAQDNAALEGLIKGEQEGWGSADIFRVHAQRRPLWPERDSGAPDCRAARDPGQG